MKFRFLFAYCFLLAFLFAACHSSPLKKALKQAGINRKSFESVLEYYSGNPADSLKLKAAKFLIENTPGHYSYSEVYWQEEYYNEIEQAINPLQTAYYHKEAFEKISVKYIEKSKNITYDIHLLKAPQLVDHIERSFEVWQNGDLYFECLLCFKK